MPSPFPGMDPWLEDPAHWGNVHARLIADTQTALNRAIRPKYVARIEERLYLVPDDDPTLRQRRVTDVRVERNPGRKRRPAVGGAVATAPLVMTTVAVEEERERYLAVVERDTQAVVAILEVLSPSNKTAGAESRHQFLAKRRQVVGSPVHWVEIDLLRAGERHGFQALLAPHDYLCHVSPADRRPEGLVWPVRLAEQLPVIDIPLQAGDRPAKLDLQAVFEAGHEAGGWEDVVRYRRPPVPPLSPESDAWADALLRAKGLR